MTATIKLHKLNPVKPCPPMALTKNPPIKAPTIPTTILAIAPISASFPIIMLAIHPASAPKTIHPKILKISSTF